MLNSFEDPAHMFPPPLKTAVGLSNKVISAVPEKLVLVQYSPLKLVMEYEVLLVGITGIEMVC